MDWNREIVELHEFFEAYFLGEIERSDIARLEAALADDFTMLGPYGVEAARATVVAQVVEGHAHTASLQIKIEDARVLVETGDLIVARYVEVHELTSRSNRRITTVVFEAAPDAPNGLRWRTAQETWIPDPD